MSKKSILFWIFLVSALLVFSVNILQDRMFIRTEIAENEYIELDCLWDVYVEGKLYEKDVTLPWYPKEKIKGSMVTFTTTLPDYVEPNWCASIVEAQEGLIFQLDGNIVYTFPENYREWDRPYFGGNTTHFIRLGDSPAGKTFSITRYNRMSDTIDHINEVSVGTKIALITKEVSKNLMSPIMGLIETFMGIFIIIMGVIFANKNRNTSFIPMGLISLLIGFWVFSQSKTKFIIVSDCVSIFNFSFIAMYLLPLALSRYLICAFDLNGYRRQLYALPYVSAALYIIISLLQIFNITNHYELITVGGVLFMVYAIYIMVFTIVMIRKGHRELKVFLLAILCLLCSVLPEVIYMFLNRKVPTEVFIHIGVVAFNVVLLAYSIEQERKRLIDDKVAMAKLEMLYTDILTGTRNRLSFNEDLEKIDDSKTFGILLLDLNSLKSINDTRGHIAGDRAIKDLSDTITGIVGNNARTYRIGGDEFVVFVKTDDPKLLDALSQKIYTSYGRMNTGYSVAIGSTIHVPSSPIEKDIAVADRKMYIDKALKKESLQPTHDTV